jgi:ATP-binding cassette subfamily B protein
VIKAYSLEDQQNNMVSLAKESKSKSLSLAKQSLFGPLMLALIELVIWS